MKIIVFTASFGPGGFRTTRVHMGGRRPAGAQGREETSMRTLLAQLAPLIILFLFTFLSAIPNLFSSPRVPDPRFSFAPSARFNMGRETSGRNVKYFVNQAEFSAHPIGKDSEQSPSLLGKFERAVEASYIDQIYMMCQRDQERQQRKKESKMCLSLRNHYFDLYSSPNFCRGFFGIGADWEAIKEISAEKLETCEEYNRMVRR